MKFIGAFLTVVLVQQARACYEYNSQTQICTGDIVYKGNVYSTGAMILVESEFPNVLIVRSNFYSTIHFEKLTDLHIARGCIVADEVCVGDLVAKSAAHSNGGVIIAINPHRRKVTVKSNYSGRLYEEYSHRIVLTK